jgi:hypothetical protein
MQIQYSYRAIDKEHEPWQRALGNVIEHALKPLLDKHTKDSARLQIVLDRDKIKRQFLASGYMHLPGKKIVSVTASHDELTPLADARTVVVPSGRSILTDCMGIKSSAKHDASACASSRCGLPQNPHQPPMRPRPECLYCRNLGCRKA